MLKYSAIEAPVEDMCKRQVGEKYILLAEVRICIQERFCAPNNRNASRMGEHYTLGIACKYS